MTKPVLYLHSSARLYGSDRTLLHLVAHLDRARFEPLVVLPESGPLVGALQNLGIEVQVRPLSVIHRSLNPLFWIYFLFNLFSSTWALKRLIKERGIVLIHSNTSHILDGAFAARLAKIPHVWHVREIHIGLSKIGRLLSRFIYAYSDLIFPMSKAVQDVFFGHDDDASKLHIIYDGVDAERFSPLKRGMTSWAAYGIDAQTPLVAVVGRIAHWKGHHLYLQAAALAHQQCPEARFLIVGDAVTPGDHKLKQELQQLAQTLGIADVVIFTGLRDDVPEIMADLRVHVLPSESPEPWGLVVLEAMAAGVPVVATRQGGPLEMVLDGETGFLVPHDDPQKMADALLFLLQNPEDAATMGQAGRLRCQELFTLQKAAQDVMALYESIL